MPEARLAVETLREGKVLGLQQITDPLRDANTKKRTCTCITHDAASNTYRCPAGETMSHEIKGKRYDWDGRSTGRSAAPIRACASVACTQTEYRGNQKKGRQINRNEFDDHREAMQRLLKTERGQAEHKRRGQMVEPRIGYWKAGLRRLKFLRCGLEKLRSELTWHCAALNMGVLLRNFNAVWGG